MTQFLNIFVTVGTTKFEQFIDTVFTAETLSVLQQIGCKQLTVQYGNGREIDKSSIQLAKEKYGIECECYRLKPSIANDIRNADLVLSHAGAGSCFEILTAKKPLLVVVNEELMNNHQIELAEQLYNDGVLLFCAPKTLNETLLTRQSALRHLQPYEPGNVRAFVRKLDEFMGF